jgi:hypothetical protein
LQKRKELIGGQKGRPPFLFLILNMHRKFRAGTSYRWRSRKGKKRVKEVRKRRV